MIEYHGDQKLDAPSGTSIKTAELIAEARRELKQGNPDEEEPIEGARGGYYVMASAYIAFGCREYSPNRRLFLGDMGKR